MKFGLDMMSRLYHESIPDIVMRALDNEFNNQYKGFSDFDGETVETNGYRDLMKLLWAERPSDRLANIALNCKKLLSGSQLTQWELVKKSPEFWVDPTEFTEQSLRRDVLALNWDALQQKFI